MHRPSPDFPIDGRAARITRLPGWSPDVSRSRSRKPDGTPVTSAPASYSFVIRSKLYEAGVDVTGVPSGFRDLDRLTSGLQPGNLVILAARPSMGKSALALCMAANLGVRSSMPVALFTLEMSKAEVTQRLMCSEAKVESNRVRSGKLTQEDWPRLTAACDKLMKAPIYVDDTGSITMMELLSLIHI